MRSGHSPVWHVRSGSVCGRCLPKRNAETFSAVAVHPPLVRFTRASRRPIANAIPKYISQQSLPQSPEASPLSAFVPVVLASSLYLLSLVHADVALASDDNLVSYHAASLQPSSHHSPTDAPTWAHDVHTPISALNPVVQLALEASPKAPVCGCEEPYGLLPCSLSVGGNVFLMLAYGALLLYAARLISEGSELLPEVPHF